MYILMDRKCSFWYGLPDIIVRKTKQNITMKAVKDDAEIGPSMDGLILTLERKYNG